MHRRGNIRGRMEIAAIIRRCRIHIHTDCPVVRRTRHNKPSRHIFYPGRMAVDHGCVPGNGVEETVVTAFKS